MKNIPTSDYIHVHVQLSLVYESGQNCNVRNAEYAMYKNNCTCTWYVMPHWRFWRSHVASVSPNLTMSVTSANICCNNCHMIWRKKTFETFTVYTLTLLGNSFVVPYEFRINKLCFYKWRLEVAKILWIIMSVSLELLPIFRSMM